MQNGLKDNINVGFFFHLNEKWMGGITYFNNLFIALSKIEAPKIIPCIYKSENEYEKEISNNCKVCILKKNFFYRIQKILYGKKNSYEVMLMQNNIAVTSHISQLSKKIPAISWIPDFQHLHLPSMFQQSEIAQRNNYYKYLAQNSKLIILSSNDALEDFKKFTPEYQNKARVLHFVSIPDDDIYQKTDLIKNDIIKKFNLPEKYFYIPNQFWKHKNHKVVFEAAAILKQKGIDINIICSGYKNDYRNNTFFKEIQNFINKNALNENIKILGLLDKIEVYYLMRNCISIINPSLFEGWSSTVEEAKSLGKNIILSNLNVHKEQNPPNGIYFDPQNPKELAQILEEKWIKEKSEPDFELEKSAREKLPKRILEFGKTYQKIVLEGIRKNPNKEKFFNKPIKTYLKRIGQIFSMCTF